MQPRSEFSWVNLQRPEKPLVPQQVRELNFKDRYNHKKICSHSLFVYIFFWRRYCVKKSLKRPLIKY